MNYNHPFLLEVRNLSKNDDFFDLPLFYLGVRSRTYLVPALINYGLPGDWEQEILQKVLSVLDNDWNYIRQAAWCSSPISVSGKPFDSSSYLSEFTRKVHVCISGFGEFEVNGKKIIYQPGSIIEVPFGLTTNRFNGVNCEHFVYCVGRDSEKHIKNWDLYANRKK